MAAWWIGLTAVGAGIIALQISEDPLITLSDTHAPGLVDLVGIVVVLAGTAVLYRHLIATRKTIMERMGRLLTTVLVLSWLVAIGATVVAVGLDRGWWWLVGAVDATAAQAFALAMSAPERTPSETSAPLDEN